MGNTPPESKYASQDTKRGVAEEVQAEESDQDREDKTSEGDFEVSDEVISEVDSCFRVSNEESPEESLDSEVKPPRRSERHQSRTPPYYRDVDLVCDYCPELFETEAALLQHKHDEHIGELAKEEEQDQRRHMAKFNRKRKNNVVCPDCTMNFSLTTNLKNHLKTCHKDSDVESTVVDDDSASNYNNETREEEREQLSETFKYSENKDWSFLCDFCQWSFSTEQVKQNHMKMEHTVEESDNESSIAEGEENFCVQADQTVYENKTDVRREENKPTVVSDLCKCSECGKLYVNIDFLNKHKLTHQPQKPAHSCSICGEVFASRIRLVEHEQICFEPPEDNFGNENEHVSENVSKTNDNMDFNDNGSSNGSPPSKRPLFENSENVIGERQSVPAQVSSNEEVAATIGVKKEVDDVAPAEDNTQLVPKNLAVARENSYDESKVKIEEDDDCMIIYDKNMSTHIHTVPQQTFSDRISTISRIPARGSQASQVNSSDGVSTCSKRPARIRSTNPTEAEERIQKDSLPLSTAIITRSIPNALMVVWVDKLDDDLIVSVKSQAESAILLIRELDTVNLSNQQKDLINKSDHFTFNILNDDNTSSLWTVITFGDGNSPTQLARRIFKTFAAVEKLLSDFAEARGEILHHFMRYSKEDLFPELSSSLQKKVTAFNFQE